MDEKKLHTQEFQLKGSSRNMKCKLLQKRFTGKTTSVPNTWAILPLKKIFYQNRHIFQISLKYIKIVIPKILFIYWYYAVLILTSKLHDPPNNITPHPPKKFMTFSEVFNLPTQAGVGGVYALLNVGVMWPTKYRFVSRSM